MTDWRMLFRFCFDLASPRDPRESSFGAISRARSLDTRVQVTSVTLNDVLVRAALCGMTVALDLENGFVDRSPADAYTR